MGLPRATWCPMTEPEAEKKETLPSAQPTTSRSSSPSLLAQEA